MTKDSWLIRRLHRDAVPYPWAVPLMVYLTFATHVLLDSFTVYGTQIFWPVVKTPMTWSTIFIIDPLYTLPLLIGVIAALAGGRRAWWHRANLAGLALSTLHLGWSLGAKLYMDEVARESVAAQQLEAPAILTTPTPFNTVLWRFLAMTEDGDNYEAFHSVFEDPGTIHWQGYRSDRRQLTAIENSWVVQRLQWFTKGFYAVERIGDGVVMTDLRMGIEPDYVFRFKVAEASNPHTKPAKPLERIVSQRPMSAFRWLWARLRSPNAGSWVEWRRGQQSS